MNVDFAGYSVVIPYMRMDEVREARVHNNLTYLSALGFTDMVVAEQGGYESTLDLSGHYGARHIQVPMERGPNGYWYMNRGLCLNMGAKYTEREHLLLVDADHIVPLQSFAAYQGEMRVYRPTKRLRYLSREDTAEFIRSGFNFDVAAGMGGKTGHACGGSCIIPREAFMQVGGYSLGYKGWGGEDDDFWARCDKILGKVQVLGPGLGMHLWHPPARTFRKNPGYANNKLILDRVRRSSVEKAEEIAKEMRRRLESEDDTLLTNNELLWR